MSCEEKNEMISNADIDRMLFLRDFNYTIIS